MSRPIVLVGNDFGSLQSVLQAWASVYAHYKHVLAADLMFWWKGDQESGERLALEIDIHLIFKISFEQPPAKFVGSEVKLCARDAKESEYMVLQDPGEYRFYGAQWKLVLHLDIALHPQISVLISGAKDFRSNGKITGLTVVEH